MHKIKRLINCVLPLTMCNFKCHYCYLSQEKAFNKNIPKLKYDLDTIQKALRIERLGGTCLVNLCAVGETMMAPYIIELTKRMLENGHYVAIVTNGSITNKFKQLCNFSEEERSKLFIKFSYQYLELKRLNLIDVFFENVGMIKKAKISYTIEVTANDETIDYIDELSSLCIKRIGAKPHVIESRNNNNSYKKLTKLKNKEHMKKWNTLNSPAIKFQDKQWGEKRKEFCYAGDWEMNLYLETGNFTTCFAGGPCNQNIFEDIEEPLHFCAVGNKCPWDHCFASHVLLTMGIIPELEAPSYDKIRNRKNEDGTEWLQSDVKKFFQSKFIDNNKEYNQDKKNIINWYRDIEQNSKSNYTSKIAKSLEKILKSKNIKKIAIHENGKFSDSLNKVLEKTSINIKYVLSSNYYESKSSLKQYLLHKNKYILKKILRPKQVPVLNYYDKLPNVDAIIVTDLMNFSKIKTNLKKITKQKVILITDLDME